MVTCPNCNYRIMFVPESGACAHCGTELPVPAQVGAPPTANTPLRRDPRPGAAAPPPPPPLTPVVPSVVASRTGTVPAAPIAATDASRAEPGDYFLPSGSVARVTTAPARTRSRGGMIAAATAVAAGVGLLVVGWVFVGGGGDKSNDKASDKNKDDMTVLPGVGENGNATLTDAFRIEAEANLHSAIAAVSVAYAELGSYADATPEMLSQYDPSFTWVPGTQASTDAKQVSLSAPDPETAVLAVAGRADICAFARATAIGIEFVTVETSAPCRAVDAPQQGWGAAGGTGMPGLSGSPGIPQIPGYPGDPSEFGDYGQLGDFGA